MPENNFTQRMATKSDDDLLVILYNKDDYQVDAYEAARQEVIRRNLPQEKLENAQILVVQARKAKSDKANEPLDGIYKVLTFLFPAVITLILSRGFERNGYDRKANELVKWTVLGFGFYGSIVIIMIVLNQ